MLDKPAVAPEPASSWLRDTMRVTLRNPGILIGGTVLLVMVVLAAFAPVLFTIDPRELSPARRLRPMSAEFWFGTDMLGRDIYSRVVYGAQVSLLVGIAVALLSCIIGTVIGMAAASWRWLDGILMRIMDGVMAIPGVLLAIALMAATGGSVQNVIIAITLVEIPRIARTVRGTVLSLREQPYVEAAIASGSTKLRIIFRHYLPGCVAPLIVQGTYICAVAIVLEAVLSFIGAGTPPTIPSWGNMMADGKAVWQLRPDLVFIPAIFLTVLVLAINLLGDGLRDALDPHLATRH